MFGYWTHDLSPFALELFPGVGLRWYGLAYVGGFIIGWWLMRRWCREGWLPIAEADVGDFMFWVAFMGVVVGGRLGYCFFYRLPSTLADPLSIFRVWEGGMASHGGIAGLWLGSWIYARLKHLPMLRLTDALALAAPPGIFLGRVANFINGELWGRPTWVPWGVIFPESPMPGVPRHPSQLYEAALEGLVLWAVLYWAKRKSAKPGAVVGALMVAYPILRIIGECFREPDENIHYLWAGITYGQLLSAVMLVLGLILLRLISRREDPAAAAN